MRPRGIVLHLACAAVVSLSLIPYWGSRNAAPIVAAAAPADPCAPASTTHQPPVRTISIGPGAYAVAVAARPPRVLVANGGQATYTPPTAGTLTLLCPATGRVLRRTAVGGSGYFANALAVDDALGLAYLTVWDANSLDLFSTVTGKLLRAIPVAAHPLAVTVDTTHRQVFVVSESASFARECSPQSQPGVVTILDALTGAAKARIPVGRCPDALALDPRTSRLFVSNHQDNTVSVLDTAREVLVRTQPVHIHPHAFAVDELRNKVFVIGQLGAGGSESPFPPGWVDVLDARSGVALQAYRVSGAAPYAFLEAIDLDPGRQRLYVAWDGPALGYGSFLSTVDERSGKALHTIAVDPRPTAVRVDSQRGRILVAAMATLDTSGNPVPNGSVTIIDAASGAVRAKVPVGTYPLDLLLNRPGTRVFVITRGSFSPPGSVSESSNIPPLDTGIGTLTTIDLTRF